MRGSDRLAGLVEPYVDQSRIEKLLQHRLDVVSVRDCGNLHRGNPPGAEDNERRQEVGGRSGEPAVPRHDRVCIFGRGRQHSHRGERISVVLNDEGVPMPGGGSRWLKSSVDRLLHTKYAREILEEPDAE